MRAAFQDGRAVSAGVQQGSGGGADPMAFDHAAHRTVLRDFFRAVQNGSAPAVTGRSALDVQRVIEAVMASSQAGSPVPLHPAALIPVM
jgi:predicted dehydrogenase